MTDEKCPCNLCDMIEKTTWISVKDKQPPYGWMLICYKYYADAKILC